MQKRPSLPFVAATDCSGSRPESHVILYPEGMAKLNETAAAILELVDGRRDVAAIIAMLNERFPEAGGVDDDVIEFLQIACQQKWITCREPE